MARPYADRSAKIYRFVTVLSKPTPDLDLIVFGFEGFVASVANDIDGRAAVIDPA
jgi:hypothetical protein